MTRDDSKLTREQVARQLGTTPDAIDQGPSEDETYAIAQAGYVGRERYATRREAQVAADEANLLAEEELGEELWGDGAASVIRVAPKQGDER